MTWTPSVCFLLVVLATCETSGSSSEGGIKMKGKVADKVDGNSEECAVVTDDVTELIDKTCTEKDKKLALTKEYETLRGSLATQKTLHTELTEASKAQEESYSQQSKAIAELTVKSDEAATLKTEAAQAANDISALHLKAVEAATAAVEARDKKKGIYTQAEETKTTVQASYKASQTATQELGDKIAILQAALKKAEEEEKIQEQALAEASMVTDDAKTMFKRSEVALEAATDYEKGQKSAFEIAQGELQIRTKTQVEKGDELTTAKTKLTEDEDSSARLAHETQQSQHSFDDFEAKITAFPDKVSTQCRHSAVKDLMKNFLKQGEASSSRKPSGKPLDDAVGHVKALAENIHEKDMHTSESMSTRDPMVEKMVRDGQLAANGQ